MKTQQEVLEEIKKVLAENNMQLTVTQDIVISSLPPKIEEVTIKSKVKKAIKEIIKK